MKRVFRKQKPKSNYAFIDSQNLNLGIQRAGWKLDWKKFRVYLKEKYDVEKAFMFIGYLPENEDLYTQMHDAGYLVALKPTLEMFTNPEDEKKDDKEKPPTKGNVDAELVMYVMKELPNYHKAIIVSGDGDFYSLIEYIAERQKLLCIMTPNWRYSTLLKPFERYIVRLDTLRYELSYRTHFSRKKKQEKAHSSEPAPKVHSSREKQRNR